MAAKRARANDSRKLERAVEGLAKASKELMESLAKMSPEIPMPTTREGFRVEILRAYGAYKSALDGSDKLFIDMARKHFVRTIRAARAHVHGDVRVEIEMAREIARAVIHELDG